MWMNDRHAPTVEEQAVGCQARRRMMLLAFVSDASIMKFGETFQSAFISAMNFTFRTAAPNELAGALLDARDHTLTLFDCFAAAGLDVP